MLEEKIEELYNTIAERTHQWNEYVKLFGKDHAITKGVFDSLWGLEEAFKILSGRSYTSVVIERLDESMKALGGTT